MDYVVRAMHSAALIPTLLAPAVFIAASDLGSSPQGIVDDPASERGLLQDDEPQDGDAKDGDAETNLARAFEAAGVIVDRDAQLVAFPATVEIRSEPLEYILVSPNGAVHESMFITPIDPKVLSTAFLAIGAKEGKNVEYIAVEPSPTLEEVRAGARTHDVILPKGDPVYLYAAWREPAGAYDEDAAAFPEETVQFHRIEDLVLDLRRGRTLRRHGMVWLGSRMLDPKEPGGPPRFAASLTGNLMSVTFFSQGDALLTTALPECTSQVDWLPNQFFLPERGQDVLLFASLEKLDVLPESLHSHLPFAEQTYEPR